MVPLNSLTADFYQDGECCDIRIFAKLAIKSGFSKLCKILWNTGIESHVFIRQERAFYTIKKKIRQIESVEVLWLNIQIIGDRI